MVQGESKNTTFGSNPIKGTYDVGEADKTTKRKRNK